MTNVNHTTLYVGVTSDLYARISDHKEGRYPNSFTYRYHVTKLVYYESFHSIQEAIDREKQLKARASCALLYQVALLIEANALIISRAV